ncbi:MAG TPA: patatin-like phospholipase family protein [Erysipelothrix sp.]|nr:patatin-like phospholipase family protein [Erysipelothrix sp.]
MKEINVALSGGGLKSFAQIAVLYELEKRNIKISAISGTSMGSMIATLIALGLDAQSIEKEMLELESIFDKNHILFKPSPKILPFKQDKITGGYIDGGAIELILDNLFDKYGIKNINEVKIPLAIPSVDLKTGQLIVFVNDKDTYLSPDSTHIIIDDIKLSTAIRASSSIPFVFSACAYEDYLLIDGGVKLNVPVSLLKGFSSNKTLAITAKDEIDTLEKRPGIFELINQVYAIISTEFDIYLSKEADYSINFPVGRKQFSLGKGKEIIENAHSYLANIDDFLKN